MSANQAFVCKDDGDHEELSKLYLEIVKIILPGRALRWGKDKNIFQYISTKFIDESIQELTTIEKRLNEKSNQSLSDKALLQSVLLRKFEFEEMECWKSSPYFYLERYIKDFIDYIRDEKKEKNSTFYKESTDYLHLLIEFILKHFEVEKMSTLDIKYSLYQISNLISLLEKDESKEYSLLIGYLNFFKKELKELVYKVPQFTNPLGYRRLSKLITLNSGITINLLDLKKQCIDYLTIEKLPLINTLLNQSNQFVLDESLIENYIDEIYKAFNGSDSDIPDNLKNVPIFSTDMKHRIFYQRKNILTQQQYKLVVSKKFYPSAERIKLDLVHEIYPGHHYERSTYYDFCKRDIALQTNENIIFIEGWAQIVQDNYCDIVNNPLINAYNSEDKRAIYIKAICTLLVHDKHITWNECISILSNLIEIDRNVIVSMMIEAYLEPLDNIAPLIGYISLKSIDKDKVDKLIYNTNRFSLWEA